MDENNEGKEVAQKKSKEHKVTEKLRENPWILSTIVVGVLVLILIASNLGGATGKVISEKEAGEMLLSYLEEQGATGVTVADVEKAGNIYNVILTYQGNEIPFYITKDGYIIGNSLVSIIPEKTTQTSTTTTIPKTDKPVVELFVMSYCPYGTQAEKGIIPVAELLGDSIDFRIRYVYYTMHGEKEITENLREYCIQENEPEKFLDYMACFLEGDGDDSSGYIKNGNDVNICLNKAGIDVDSLNVCMTETDKEYGITEALNSGDSYPLFNVDADLNEKYGVQGSPTLVINGQQVNSARDSASYLDAICQAFSDESVSELCGTELSSETPSVYFGWDSSSGSTSTGSCS